MAGNDSDSDSVSMACSEGDESRINEWESDGKGKKGKSRKRKKKHASSIGDSESDGSGKMGKIVKEGILNVVVRFEGEGGIKKIDPIKLTKIIKNQIGEVKYARVLGDGNLLIGCENEIQLDKAKKMTYVGKVKVQKVAIVGERRVNGCKGVIYGIPINVNNKEIMENMRVGNFTVKNVKRLTKGIEKKETESILIEFEEKELPKEVYFGYVKYNVREYVQKPMRCYNCQEFGHIAKMCKWKKRCARCGGEHDYGMCGEGIQPKCCNCGGNHSVAYWGCEALKREVEVQKLRLKEKVSYAEAVKMNGQRNQNIEIRVNKGQEEVNVQQGKRKAWIEKKKLVTFIAGVINATHEIKSKTERIQVIVKAAEHHLDMIGLKWEEINDELRMQASQETSGLGS